MSRTRLSKRSATYPEQPAPLRRHLPAVTPQKRTPIFGLWLMCLLWVGCASPSQAQQFTPQGPPNTGIGCAYNSSLPTLTTGFPGWVQCDSSGTLLTAPKPGATWPISGTVTATTTIPVGAANFAVGQISCTSTATQIVAARTGAPGTGRVALTIENTGTTPVYVGGSGVTTATGMLLPGITGASITLNLQPAFYCITASTSQTISYVETY